MELPNKNSEQITFNTRPKVQENILIVINKFIHEEHLAEPLQSNNKDSKRTITFLNG